MQAQTGNMRVIHVYRQVHRVIMITKRFLRGHIKADEVPFHLEKAGKQKMKARLYVHYVGRGDYREAAFAQQMTDGAIYRLMVGNVLYGFGKDDAIKLPGRQGIHIGDVNPVDDGNVRQCVLIARIICAASCISQLAQLIDHMPPSTGKLNNLSLRR